MLIEKENFSIAIIGGGLGGLAAALALQQSGFNVIVYERDNLFSDRKQGYGLTLTNNSKGPLAKLGVLNEVLAKDCPSYRHFVFKPSGTLLGYYGRELKETISNDAISQDSNTRGNIRIPRQDLRNILLNKLKPGTVMWDHSLVSYDEDNEGISLFFDSNKESEGLSRKSIRANLLIGADGINSVVRRINDTLNYDVIQSPLRYIGVSVIIGLSKAVHPLVNKGGFYVLDGKHHRLFVMPFREASACLTCTQRTGDELKQCDDCNSTCQLTMWQLSFSGVDEKEGLRLKKASSEDIKAEAMRRTSSWLEPVAALIHQTSAADVWATPLYDRDPMQQRPKSKTSATSAKRQKLHPDDASVRIPTNYSCPQKVTVLGDAAHPMSMFKGQGCNQAMEDGPLLASWLARPGLSTANVVTRLRCFEREMVARSASKVIGSRQAAELYHSPQALEEPFGFEGVAGDELSAFTAALADQGVTAGDGAELTGRMKATLDSIRHK